MDDFKGKRDARGMYHSREKPFTTRRDGDDVENLTPSPCFSAENTPFLRGPRQLQALEIDLTSDLLTCFAIGTEAGWKCSEHVNTYTVRSSSRTCSRQNSPDAKILPESVVTEPVCSCSRDSSKEVARRILPKIYKLH